MKKIFTVGVIACLSLNLFGSITEVPRNINYKLNTDDVAYRYNFKKLSCERLDYSLRAEIIRMARNNILTVENMYENSAGTALETSYEDRGTIYEMVLADTYGECRLYQDVVINSKKVNADDIKRVYAPMKLR